MAFIFLPKIQKKTIFRCSFNGKPTLTTLKKEEEKE